MATTTRKRAVSTSQVPCQDQGVRTHGKDGTVVRRPYSVREAAALLGVSPDAIEGNYQDLEGFRVGRRILIPRRVVDQLVGVDGDEHDEDTPAVERVLALLPLLARDERVKVAQVALAVQQG